MSDRWFPMLALPCLLAGCAGGAPESGAGLDAASDAVIEDGDDGKEDGAPASPWTSRAACEARLAGRHRAARASGVTRLATWNVRWFPLGRAPFDDASTATPTDVDWLACAIAWTRPDVLALEEVLTTPDAVAALDALVARLGVLDGAPWRKVVLDCPDPELQHQAFLYREDRVDLGEAAAVSLRDDGFVCSSSTRPALRARLTARGLPLELYALHLKSGADARSYGLRRGAMAALAGPLFEARTRAVALGDLNSMGCSGCSPKITASEELAELGAELQVDGVPRAAPDVACTEYAGTHAGLLDHVGVAGGGVAAHVDGVCRALACAAPGSPRPSALVTLSDHCPVWVDLPVP